jgi:hypothetical protein
MATCGVGELEQACINDVQIVQKQVDAKKALITAVYNITVDKPTDGVMESKLRLKKACQQSGEFDARQQ